MFRYVLVSLLLLVISCFGAPVEAADLPLSLSADQTERVKVPAVRKKVALASRSAAATLKPRTVKLDKLASKNRPLVKLSKAPEIKAAAQDGGTAPAVAPAPGEELELSWFLDTLVANADGPKGEGSASTEGNLIVAEPGVVTSPYMVIELSGHIVKTPATTVRLDVRIGNVQRSVNWSADKSESGRFSVSLDAPMKAGALPGYFPVSVLALVSREGKKGAAMVSLEKVRVKLGKVNQVATK